MTQQAAGSTQHLKIGLLAADLTHKHGWAHVSTSVIAALSRAGVECVVLTTRDSPSLDGVETHAILPPVDPMARGLLASLVRAYPAARRMLADCDAIHALIEPFAPLGGWIAGARPFYVTGHGSYVRVDQAYSRIARPFYVQAFRRATLICVSRYTADAAQTALPGARTVIVPNGVEMERFAALQRDKADRFARTPTILSVGAVKRRKGTLELVEAFARVRPQIPGARLHIVGSLTLEPAYVERVRAAIQQHDLGAAVTLAGRISDADLMRAYADADVFALPSLNDGWKFEGFGLSLLEASAAGLPVIGTQDCGAADAVQDGVTGLLVPQDGLVAHLSDALMAVLRDAEMARRMGAAGRMVAAAQTWDVAAGKLLDVYGVKRSNTEAR
ncbi:MAG: glycosyltransferase family 4 protein [Chloroflexota bacterium]|nr:glycosyltransferase family 4 protein [Chloroflexota bacterium]